MPGSFKKAVWLAEVSTIPQLVSMAIKLGTAGTYVPIMTGTDNWSILNRPLIITEKLPVLGDAGTLLLADFSQYLILLKEGGFRLETSKDYKFRQDQSVFRMIARLDGQPAINHSLTLKSGTVVYPFVLSTFFLDLHIDGNLLIMNILLFHLFQKLLLLVESLNT